MTTDLSTALIDLVAALQRGAGPDELLDLTDRAIELVEWETELIFGGDDNVLVEKVA